MASNKAIPNGTAAKTAIISSVFWLAMGTTLGFVTSLKLSYPDVLAGTPYLNFGHIRPVHVLTVIYAWISMAFAAAMYYMTPVLCGTRLWSERLGVMNIWLWNLGIMVADVSLDLGMSSGREYSDFAWPIDIYVIAFILVPLGVNVWMTVLTRTVKGIYPTTWIMMAGLLYLVTVYSMSQSVEVFHVTGLNEALITWWNAHNQLGIWITPISIGIAMYLIPKLSGNPLYSHKLAHLTFWGLFAFYSTPGAHHMMGAPIPEWLKSFASVSGVLILVPGMAFIANALLTMQGKWKLFVEVPSLRWAITGTLMGIPLFFQGGFQQTRAINWYIHGTHWIVAHAHLALLGFSSFVEIGAMYYGLERLLKRKFNPTLELYHYWLMTIGFIIFWTSLTAAGLIQAAAKVYEIPYVASIQASHPYMVARSWGGFMIITGQWIFLYNLYRTATAPAHKAIPYNPSEVKA